MDLKNQRQSSNFVDRTGWTDERRSLHTIATLFNPAHAAANAHSWLRAKGIAPMPPLIKLGKPGVVDILKGN